MLSAIDPASVRFDEPQYLWLLLAPAVLLVVWMWRVGRYRQLARRFRARRTLPIREHLPLAGGLFFWLFATIATTFTVLALARPSARAAGVRRAGLDVVVLQDGSASMRTADVPGDRWQRSIRFVRVVGESLQWTNDRVAMALFAHIATPEVRLTNDPNTLFFFLDHLDRSSPFRQEDDTTWDTNIESGIYWGVRLVEKDEQINGRSPNAKVFVLISDGQTWSGNVARAIELARGRSIPIYVVGVGTLAGGIIPEPPPKATRFGVTPPTPIRSSLDRLSLVAIAEAGGGEYMELDRETDRDIANRIIDAGRRRAGAIHLEASIQSLYWRCLVAAAGCLGLGLVFVRDRAELVLNALGAGAALATMWIVLR